MALSNEYPTGPRDRFLPKGLRTAELSRPEGLKPCGACHSSIFADRSPESRSPGTVFCIECLPSTAAASPSPEMAGKPVSEKTRSKKFSNLAKEKIKSPNNVGTTSTACSSATEGTKKKSRKSDEPNSDDDVKFIGEVKVEVDEESKKGKKNGKKDRATRKVVNKNKAIDIIEPVAKSEKKKKVIDVSRQKGEGKKEEKKKRKKVEEEDNVALLGVQDTTGEIKQRSESKEDKKSKGKEVGAKSPEKLKKGSGVSKLPEGKNNDKKNKVEGEKERTVKRRNEGEPLGGKSDDKKRKMEGGKERSAKKRNEAELSELKNDGKKKKVKGDNERTGKSRNEGEKEDEKSKKKSNRQKTEVQEAKKQMNVNKNQRTEEAKKEKKKEAKKRKKKVEELEMEEENEKNNNVLYQFPMAQVSRIIKSEEFNTKIAQEAVFVINKSVEKFLELFCKEAYACAFLDHKNHVAYNHLYSVVSKRRRFDFLSDFVPEKVKAEDALAEMSKAEEETETDT